MGNLYREVYKVDPPKSKAAYRIVEEMLDLFRDEADDETDDEYDGYSEKYYLNRSNLTCGCPECLKNDWENCSCEMSKSINGSKM